MRILISGGGIAALYEALNGKVEIRYGTELENVRVSAEGVATSLSDGRTEARRFYQAPGG